jgi:hypothetical protein
MKGYCSIKNIEDYLLTDIDLNFQASVEGFIESIEALIDQETGRSFVADEDASARYFHGTGSTFLKIDDCVDVEKVEYGDTYGDSFVEVEEDDYILVPRTGVPIKGIYLKNDYWQVGQSNHKITARWGYSEEAPADIRFVATVLVAGIIKNNMKNKGDVVSERIGDYSVSYDKDKGLNDFSRAKSILDSYKLFLI